ncbi:hypothetical protein V502_02063 [Pseudogymnoascus sp. VKM F-4520 (FW-2644)]|nr:hypothetical protein V502_02063 [Pseudogymnoascus sp. VKM F-4520 (FW-2644)]
MAPIQFGIVMTPCQPLDIIGPLDLLSSCTKEMLQSLSDAGVLATMGFPLELGDHGIDIEFHHISDTLEPVTYIGNVKALPTTTCNTCPPLDFLLVGGPDPSWVLAAPLAEMVRDHVAAGKVLYTTCSGAICVAQTGVLDGKNATTNHGLVELAKSLYPKVKWTKDLRWVVDRNIWTAGGAVAGMDMLAYWVMENYPVELGRFSHAGLDYEPRDVNGRPLFLSKYRA